MHNFTPLASLIGGMLIGLSAAAMLLLDGKIAGISGILAGVLKPVKGDTLWRICFLTGLLAGGLLLKELLPSLSRVAVLVNPANSFSAVALDNARSGATALGLRLDPVEVSSVADLERALPALRSVLRIFSSSPPPV